MDLNGTRHLVGEHHEKWILGIYTHVIHGLIKKKNWACSSNKNYLANAECWTEGKPRKIKKNTMIPNTLWGWRRRII